MEFRRFRWGENVKLQEKGQCLGIMFHERDLPKERWRRTTYWC
ncbi:hypothetical protein BDCR2A_00417 [Borrelia duttonii CR2A]|uniref:Uncharacterized protein n=1 Tax=Borrelia duttonii CR2A TaxID=1432657 RepID=W6TM34_9SPIR|nr:hypothetical protein BDCR2A_00417 [Borrelia duttonii CR2A]